MATVNEDGSPHNTPYFFLYDDKLRYLYWSSHSNSQHSRNAARTGQVFVALYDALGAGGGLYIRAEQAHALEGAEFDTALTVHNRFRANYDKHPIPREVYDNGPQRMWSAVPTNFWVNIAERDDSGWVTRDFRVEIKVEDLIH